MIELVSVEVVNFRSFSSATFCPLGIGQGMTAVNGPNGAGKSSVATHAVMWALYGITPDGVPVRALRRQGTSDEVRVTVTFRHDGETIVVTRSLRGRNDTTTAAISLDGVEQTTVSTRTATTWITNRLGLDAEGFLTAFVVRQKELDNLVRARPAERRKRIERLAGIERMSKAIEAARLEARTATRVLDAMPETEDPAVAKAAVDQAEAALAQCARIMEETEAQAQNAAFEHANADKAVVHAREVVARVQTLTHALELLTQQHETLQAQVDRLTEAADGAADIEKTRGEALAAREELARAQQTVRDVTVLVDRAAADAERVNDAQASVQRCEAAHGTAHDNLAEAQETLTDFSGDLEGQIEETSVLVSDYAEKRGAAQGEWNRLNEAITNLTALDDHDKTCPTCSQNLVDPQTILSGLNTALDKVKADGLQHKADMDDAQARLAQLRQELVHRNQAEEKVRAATTAVESAQRALSEAQDNLARLTKIAAVSAGEATAAQKSAASAEAALPGLVEKEAAAQAALRRAESAVHAATELEKTRTALSELESTLQEKTAVLAPVRQEAEGLDLAALEDRARAAAQAANSAAQDALRAQSAHSLALREAEAATEAATRAAKAVEARREALAKVEKTQATAASLEEFRRDRLARLAPELSEVASDFVARMTDGKYTAVELDEEFTAVLTDASGTERPVSWLSGGEESAVALALRVAIGEVLAGQRGGLLILDEVLTAQDRTRRQATMAAIRALPRQIITINHVSEATDMVDLVVEVVDDGDGASTLVEAVPNDALGADLSDALIDTVA